jgi:hypothetical protein
MPGPSSRTLTLASSPEIGDVDPDLTAALAVFDRVLDQVLHQPQQFVAVAGDGDGVLRHVELQRHLALACHQYERIQDLAGNAREVDRRLRREMGAQFDAREREQVIDQACHAQALLTHDRQEAVAGGGIVASRPLQGLDEAEHGRQRRAQFVAGIGDEVDAHALGHALLAQILEGQEHGPAPAAAGKCGDMDAEGTLDRHALDQFDGAAGRHGARPARSHRSDRGLASPERAACPWRAPRSAPGAVGLSAWITPCGSSSTAGTPMASISAAVTGAFGSTKACMRAPALAWPAARRLMPER